jgi:hypothetical protein
MKRLAIHSTHEAAKKIAGIGAVLDGMLPDPDYMTAFHKTILVGPWPFPEGRHPLKSLCFDSELDNSPHNSLRETTFIALKQIAASFNTRIVWGTRNIGEQSIDVLLVNPSISLQKVKEFEAHVKNHFRFDMAAYAEKYCAIEYRPDDSLKRLLNAYQQIQLLNSGESFHNPDQLQPENPLWDYQRNTFYGGVPFVKDGELVRAVFPNITELDSFSEFYNANQYLIELQFYFFPAAALWAALNVLIDQEQAYACEEITFFSHDWMGVPLFWAIDHRSLGNRKCTTVYFAHETRLCRMLVEGNIKDKMTAIGQHCHPDGHDAAFYSYLSMLQKDGFAAGLSNTFSAVMKEIPRESPFPRAFQDVYYHEINRQAVHFDKIVVVGGNVERETKFILADCKPIPPISVCPNGIPNIILNRCAKTINKPSISDLIFERNAANKRLKFFTSEHFGFNINKPIYIVTSVSRCELSKAPWRNLEFFKAFTSHLNSEEQAIFIWLSRPKPLPTPSDIDRWQNNDQLWPLTHSHKANGGDLRDEEESLWEMISEFNMVHKNFKVLYVNQFGWNKSALGKFNLYETTFDDLRIGIDIELGLSVYEPFGISPLEPFGSGAISVLSDACGCAVYLDQLKAMSIITDEGFVIGSFARSTIKPSHVDLRALKQIEDSVYETIIDDVLAKLQIDSHERLKAAQINITKLSWNVSCKQLLGFLIPANQQ